MPRQVSTLGFSDANAMLRAGEEAAAAAGLPYCIAVVDAGGHLLSFSRQDGASARRLRRKPRPSFDRRSHRVLREKNMAARASSELGSLLGRSRAS